MMADLTPGNYLTIISMLTLTIFTFAGVFFKVKSLEKEKLSKVEFLKSMQPVNHKLTKIMAHMGIEEKENE